MNVCILGNSHVACLKQGWDRIGMRHPDMRMTFFASRQERLKGLALQGRSLVPADAALARDIAFTSGGLDRVDLSAFDVFLVYALGLAVPAMDLRLSSAVQRLICRHVLQRSLNLSICGLIRSATQAPIFIGHNPQIAFDERLPLAPNRLPFESAVALLAEQIDLADARLLCQPAQTLFNGWNTRVELSRGSTRLDVGDSISNAEHPADEVMHMNAEFGALYMAQFAAALTALPSQAADAA